MAQFKVRTARHLVNILAATAFSLGLAGVGQAEQSGGGSEFSPFEQARNKKIGEICDEVWLPAGRDSWLAHIIDCDNEGVDISNRLWKMQDPRPFLNIPKTHNAMYTGPVLPPLGWPSCRFALAACPVAGNCLWREQVEMLIRQSDECVFPDQEQAK
jgi:hypothetical protein